MTQSLAHKIGFWSSLLFVITGLILIAANIGIGLSGQWQAWEGMESYTAWYASLRFNFFTVAFIVSFMMTVLFLGIMAALHSITPDEKKILGTLGISFTAICITLVSITYYTQLSSVPNSIQLGEIAFYSGLWVELHRVAIGDEEGGASVFSKIGNRLTEEKQDLP